MANSICREFWNYVRKKRIKHVSICFQFDFSCHFTVGKDSLESQLLYMHALVYMIINCSGMNLRYMCNLILGAMTGSRFLERSLWSGKKQFFFCGGWCRIFLESQLSQIAVLEVKCKFWPVDWSWNGPSTNLCVLMWSNWGWSLGECANFSFSWETKIEILFGTIW